MKLGTLVLAAVLVAGAGGAYLWSSRSAPEPEPRAKTTHAPSARAEKPRSAPPKPSILPDPEAPPPPSPTARPRAFVPDPSAMDTALAGFEGRDATPDDLAELPPKVKGGVVVTEVDPRSPAAEAHLEPGDVIIRAHYDDVSSPEQLEKAVKDRDHSLLTVYRDGKPFQVVLHKPWKGEK